MNKLEFDIYIGSKMVQGQSDKVAAAIIPKFYIPKGKCKVDGTELKNEEAYYFNKIYDVGTFIADWIELLNDSFLVQARIFLNRLSLHRTFNGEDIVSCIDKIDKFPNLVDIRNFNELI